MVEVCPKVSVIIPVYNAEKYIERCCESLFCQTLDAIEFIFVDDGTPDNSIEKIREVLSMYPNRLGQVKFLSHPQNRGVSFSRQQGLDAAIGEYVIHCDSDDWVEKEMYRMMYESAKRECADIACCGYFVESPGGVMSRVDYIDKDYYSTLDFNISPRTGSVWNKLIKRQLLVNNEIRFPDSINWGEDFCVSIECLVVSTRTICIKGCYYHYWQNSESITHSISESKYTELLACGSTVENFLQRMGKIEMYENQLNYLKFQLKAHLLRDRNVRDLKCWITVYPECNNMILSYDIPLYLKIVAFLSCRHLFFFARTILLMRDISIPFIK